MLLTLLPNPGTHFLFLIASLSLDMRVCAVSLHLVIHTVVDITGSPVLF